jgi:ubiquinone biosynthesis protein COQ9
MSLTPPTPHADMPERQAPADWAQMQEAALLNAALAAARDGGTGGGTWGKALFDRAAAATGLSPADAELLAPNGPLDLAALLWRRHDDQALQRLTERERPAKVRDRITLAVDVRVETAMADEAAVRAASLYLAHPGHVPTALRLGWATADGLWRWAGDTATDENHYSKRAILSGVLAGVATVRLARGPDAARAHLRASIERVMAFERFKGRLPPVDGLMSVAAASLGRLRYGPEAGAAPSRWS